MKKSIVLYVFFGFLFANGMFSSEAEATQRIQQIVFGKRLLIAEEALRKHAVALEAHRAKAAKLIPVFQNYLRRALDLRDSFNIDSVILSLDDELGNLRRASEALELEAKYAADSSHFATGLVTSNSFSTANVLECEGSLTVIEAASPIVQRRAREVDQAFAQAAALYAQVVAIRKGDLVHAPEVESAVEEDDEQDELSPEDLRIVPGMSLGQFLDQR